MFPSPRARQAALEQMRIAADLSSTPGVESALLSALEAAWKVDEEDIREAVIREVDGKLRYAGPNNDNWRPHLAPSDFLRREYGLR